MHTLKHPSFPPSPTLSFFLPLRHRFQIQPRISLHPFRKRIPTFPNSTRLNVCRSFEKIPVAFPAGRPAGTATWLLANGKPSHFNVSTNPRPRKGGVWRERRNLDWRYSCPFYNCYFCFILLLDFCWNPYCYCLPRCTECKCMRWCITTITHWL